MKTCTSFGTRVGTQIRDFLACYFGGARSKAFATLRNMSKLHSDVPKLLRISSANFEFFDFFFFFCLLFWLEILTAKVFYRNIEAIWASSFKIRAKIEVSVRLTLQTSTFGYVLSNMSRDMFLQYLCEKRISSLRCVIVHELS